MPSQLMYIPFNGTFHIRCTVECYKTSLYKAFVTYPWIVPGTSVRPTSNQITVTYTENTMVRRTDKKVIKTPQ